MASCLLLRETGIRSCQGVAVGVNENPVGRKGEGRLMLLSAKGRELLQSGMGALPICLRARCTPDKIRWMTLQSKGALMEKALATFHNGQVEFDQPVNWPKGTRLEIVPAAKFVRLDEAQWPCTLKEIDEWIEWLKNLEPFDMTPDELEAFDAELQASNETQKQLLRESWIKENHS